MSLALIATIGAVVLVASCSSSNDSVRAPTSPSTATTPPTTTANGVRIVKLTGPPSPVTCNAPTSIELHFETVDATSVTLRINGGAVFATDAGGPRDELVPLACDGSAQRYRFTARGANGTTTTRSLTVTTSQLATS